MVEKHTYANTFEPGHNIPYNIAYPHTNDSDESAQIWRLIRVIAWRFMGSKRSRLPLDRRQSFYLLCVYGHVDLILVENAVPSPFAFTMSFRLSTVLVI